MNDLATRTVREIALESPLTISVFQNHNLDFCCGGRVPLAEACAKAGIDTDMVLNDLAAVFARELTPEERSAEQKSAQELIEHIVYTHHDFTRSEIARLIPLAEKVAGKHGEHRPELLKIRDITVTLGAELNTHMQKEEMMLFPYIGSLERALKAHRMAPFPTFGSVNNPIRTMMLEHDQANDMLKHIRSLSSNYTPPEGACPSYIGLYAGLENLEKDFHVHIHLENNILFPRAIEMEEQVFRDLD